MSAATSADLFAFLDDLGIETTTTEHDAVFTVEESSALHDRLDAGAHTKNLFLKDKKQRLFLVTCLSDRKVNLKALEKALGAARCSFGKPDLLMEVLGVSPGSVTALALINDRQEPRRVTFAIDKAITDSDVAYCHPLHNEATTAISSKELMRFCEACGHKPIVIDFDAIDPPPE